ncbi:unnamed protein product [Closterium sp. NIES-64]|nr:unnamed protein product [Closterium sp. NIES-64]
MRETSPSGRRLERQQAGSKQQWPAAATRGRPAGRPAVGSSGRQQAGSERQWATVGPERAASGPLWAGGER